MAKSEEKISLEDKIRTNKFIQLIKTNELLVDLFLEAISLRETSVAISHHKDSSGV